MHPECVEEKARIVMSRLGPTLGMHGAVLASGTGLALHLGHRISGDLEFFTQRAFRPTDILEELRALAGIVQPVAMEGGTMIVEADGARLSLTEESTRFIEPTTRVNGCDVAGIIDIAAMKVMAIERDGTRNDFVDLYVVLQMMPFRKIICNALERYGGAELEPVTVGKGLVWFERADAQVDSHSIHTGVPIPWERVRDFFHSSVRQFVLDLDAERRSLGRG
ncbi:MAG: hypothetical protein ACYDH4_11670 [Candidatus Cryosericum sp.]